VASARWAEGHGGAARLQRLGAAAEDRLPAGQRRGAGAGWQRLESGAYGTLAELADAERISRSYIYRVLRLTLLAPDGRPTAGLAQFLKPFPVEWERQQEQFA
jgi:hypothetical protein